MTKDIFLKSSRFAPLLAFFYIIVNAIHILGFDGKSIPNPDGTIDDYIYPILDWKNDLGNYFACALIPHLSISPPL